MLDESQELAVEAIDSGKNVFLTGGAGSGKSYTVEHWMRNSTKNVVLTATTGSAALLLGGRTIHSFMKIGVKTRPGFADSIYTKLWNKASKDDRLRDHLVLIRKLDSLVIDEVSMLRRDQLELIDILLQLIRHSHEPFGGVQMVFTGDFYQLPPVVTGEDRGTYDDLQYPYAFQSDSWESVSTLNLEINHRQEDLDWLNLLDCIRRGEETDYSMLYSRVGATLGGDIIPTKLMSLNKGVLSENLSELYRLSGKEKRFHTVFSGDKYEYEALLKTIPVENILRLKVGAQVMFTINDSRKGWVNGTRGIIRDIMEDEILVETVSGDLATVEKYTWDRIDYTFHKGAVSERILASATNFPLKLAWATTIHKSQGMTLDCVEADLSDCFVGGQAYVALSRVKSLDGLSLRGFDPSAIITDPVVKEFYQRKN